MIKNSTVTLACYTLRLKNKADGGYCQLDSFFKGQDFHEFVEKYFQFINDLNVDERSGKTIRVRGESLAKESRIITGVIEAGQFGYTSEMINVKEKVTTYNRKVDDAEMLPFYFLIALPKGKDKGFVFLQRFRQFGIKEIFEGTLKKFFLEVNASVQVEFFPLVYQPVVEKLLNEGFVKKLVLRQSKIPSDYSNFFDGDLKEVEGHVELRIVAKKKNSLPIKEKLLSALGSNQQMSAFAEAANFQYDTVSFEVKLRYNTRTISLQNIDKLGAFFDITSQIVFDKSGHPTVASLEKVVKEIYNEIYYSFYPQEE